MTTVVVILLGVGATLIASALDCTDIKTTFLKIVQNQSIDWSGNSANCNPAASTSTITAPAGSAAAVGQAQTASYGPGQVAPTSPGQCPPGYVYVVATGKCQQVGARQ